MGLGSARDHHPRPWGSKKRTVTESTFGLPIFHWDPVATVVAEILAMISMIEAYRQAGVGMAETFPLIDLPRGSSCAGELILAPLMARGTPWMRRLGEFSDAFASGTMRVRGIRRQRNVDRGFVLPDHADWTALLETVAEVGAPRVLATRGHPEPFARYLASQGLESGVMRTAWEGEAAVQGD